jgi:hypothetical protein
MRQVCGSVPQIAADSQVDFARAWLHHSKARTAMDRRPVQDALAQRSRSGRSAAAHFIA